MCNVNSSVLKPGSAVIGLAVAVAVSLSMHLFVFSFSVMSLYSKLVVFGHKANKIKI